MYWLCSERVGCRTNVWQFSGVSGVASQLE